MSSELKPILAIAAVIAVLVLAVVGLRGVTSEVVVRPPVDLADPTDLGPDGTPAAVVMALFENEERRFFGLVGGEVSHIARIQFYASAGCITEVADGDLWPASPDACSSGVPVKGTVSGLGIAVSGETIVAVDALVSGTCFASLSPGDSWPPGTDECTGGGSAEN